MAKYIHFDGIANVDLPKVTLKVDGFSGEFIEVNMTDGSVSQGALGSTSDAKAGNKLTSQVMVSGRSLMTNKDELGFVLLKDYAQHDGQLAPKDGEFIIATAKKVAPKKGDKSGKSKIEPVHYVKAKSAMITSASFDTQDNGDANYHFGIELDQTTSGAMKFDKTEGTASARSKSNV